MDKWPAEKDADSYDQRNDVENGEKNTKCARNATMIDTQMSENVDFDLELYNNVRYHSPHFRRLSMTARSQGVGADVRGWICGDIRNTKRITEANREGMRIH